MQSFNNLEENISLADKDRDDEGVPWAKLIGVSKTTKNTNQKFYVSIAGSIGSFTKTKKRAQFDAEKCESTVCLW